MAFEFRFQLGFSLRTHEKWIEKVFYWLVITAVLLAFDFTLRKELLYEMLFVLGNYTL